MFALLLFSGRDCIKIKCSFLKFLILFTNVTISATSFLFWKVFSDKFNFFNRDDCSGCLFLLEWVLVVCVIQGIGLFHQSGRVFGIELFIVFSYNFLMSLRSVGLFTLFTLLSRILLTCIFFPFFSWTSRLKRLINFIDLSLFFLMLSCFQFMICSVLFDYFTLLYVRFAFLFTFLWWKLRWLIW